MSLAFMFMVTVILLTSCLAFGSVAGFQCGLGTSVSCLFSWLDWNMYGPTDIGCSW